MVRTVASIGRHATELGEHGQVGVDNAEMSRINLLALFLLIVHRFQLRLQFVEESEVVELVLLSGLIELKEGLLVVIISK